MTAKSSHRSARSSALQTSVVAAAIVLITALHLLVPTAPHSSHWLHIVAQKLYYLPILLAAGALGVRAALGSAALVSVLYAGHVLRDWAGLPMVQAEQLAEIASFWAVAVVASLLFRRANRALEEVRLGHEETLQALASSLELRERYTAGHSVRVRDYALLIADELGGVRAPEFRAELARGALLHDIGKIGVPDRILLKPGPLTAEEQMEMRRHPQVGAVLIGSIGFLRTARHLVLAHHERYDGKGYPTGLAGGEIPLAARIFAAADAFDAMTTDRPYRAALAYDEAAARIADGRGSQFDPDVADAFLRIPFEEWARVALATGVALKKEPEKKAVAIDEEPRRGWGQWRQPTRPVD